MHTVVAREIWINQSGFSRREKLHCPDDNVSLQESHWNQANFLSNISKRKKNVKETSCVFRLLILRQKWVEPFLGGHLLSGHHLFSGQLSKSRNCFQYNAGSKDRINWPSPPMNRRVLRFFRPNEDFMVLTPIKRPPKIFYCQIPQGNVE